MWQHPVSMLGWFFSYLYLTFCKYQHLPHGEKATTAFCRGCCLRRHVSHVQPVLVHCCLSLALSLVSLAIPFMSRRPGMQCSSSLVRVIRHGHAACQQHAIINVDIMQLNCCLSPIHGLHGFLHQAELFCRLMHAATSQGFVGAWHTD